MIGSLMFLYSRLVIIVMVDPIGKCVSKMVANETQYLQWAGDLLQKQPQPPAFDHRFDHRLHSGIGCSGFRVNGVDRQWISAAEKRTLRSSLKSLGLVEFWKLVWIKNYLLSLVISSTQYLLSIDEKTNSLVGIVSYAFKLEVFHGEKQAKITLNFVPFYTP